MIAVLAYPAPGEQLLGAVQQSQILHDGGPVTYMGPSVTNVTPKLSMTQRCIPKRREEQVWSKLVVRANGVEPTLHRGIALTRGATRGATGDCDLLGLPAGSRHFLPSLLHSSQYRTRLRPERRKSSWLRG